ncbi:cobalamin-independent methionine synthase II family protein [Rhizorhabdus histidinilytica]|uniref:5-methyltetrahydropteroyltriglutamate--homocysteine methyltransferase n=1 Tax=Rhizorhabdus histidinilytica TaxID=439228 RepID=A0A1T5G251_9SPHN|nr:cobalamin-independent methionine synthase II family protein [Rhizorhabdus histidinilytica]SKC02518.1 5-methyltetrahydropteroyltriglutamate--homocysteine methyltransferase [Rhizorhabdus histidinilytica]
MRRSTERILTTHVGSLIRPLPVLRDMMAKTLGEPVDEAAFQAHVTQGVADVVAKQAEIGIDIPSDGEISKPSFHNYVVERLGGLEKVPPEQKGPYYAMLQEEFPGFMKQYNGMYKTMWMPPELDAEKTQKAAKTPPTRVRVAAPITYVGQAALQRDLDNYKAALEGKDFVEAFMPSATPARDDADAGEVYESESAYLYALADAMHEEYKAIVDAGFVVQLDLGLPARNQVLPGNPNPTPEDLRRASERQVEAYNHALRGIPEDRVRYHMCWGSMNTPHTTDVPLREVIDIILKIKAQAYVIEGANPRHEHEWMVWKDVKLPDGKILVPGVISHQTNVVEHPELVAWRIENYASVVGRENVIAGTDCGFSQGWNMARVHPEVQWAKLSALVEGARLASQRLWA